MVKLAVVASGDALNVAGWSGTPFHITRALQTRYPDLVAVKQPRPAWFGPARRAGRKLTQGFIDLEWSETLGRRHALLLERQLRREAVHAAICIGASPLAAYLARVLPTVHVSDATSALMRTYYQEFAALQPHLAGNAQRLDMAAVLYAKACLFASPWAAQSAIDDYGADPARVFVVPLGANVEACGGVLPLEKEAGVCHVVFIGMDWQRKRGDIAVQAIMELAERGIPVSLDIVGVVPPRPLDSTVVTVHGYVSKSTKQGRETFHRIMARADFLLVPTERECFGVFAAEGAAFGIPVISTRTGGLPGVVLDGVSGFLLPPEAGPLAYADIIATVWNDKELHATLREGAKARFHEVLNWNAWLAQAGPIIDRVVTEAVAG